MGWSTRFLVTLSKCRMCLTRKTSFLGRKQDVLISRRRRTVKQRSSDGCVSTLGKYCTNPSFDPGSQRKHRAVRADPWVLQNPSDQEDEVKPSNKDPRVLPAGPWWLL